MMTTQPPKAPIPVLRPGAAARARRGLVPLLLAACHGEAPARPNWLILAPDSLRADRIGPRADGTVAAPNMSALAAEGVTFTHDYSQSGWTVPALASLLTGRYPTVIARNVPGAHAGVSWMPGTRTLPEILRYYGYHTAVFWGDSAPGRFPAYSTGFDDVDVREPGRPLDGGAGLTAWLARGDREPFFVLLHDDDFCARMDPPVPLTGAQEAIALYDEDVATYDTYVGHVIDALRAAGVYDHTVIVITSNHGMDFFEHDTYASHGSLYDSTLHVPLVIHDPDTSAREVSAMVQTIDLAPTILARSGIPLDQEMNGQSLLPLLGGSEGAYTPHEVYSGTSEFDMSVRTERYKLISCRSDCCEGVGARINAPPRQCTGPVVYKLYDHEADPGETRDVAAEHPDTVATLSAGLHAWARDRADEARGAPRWAVDDAQKRALQQRGYWDFLFPEEMEAPTGQAPGR